MPSPIIGSPDFRELPFGTHIDSVICMYDFDVQPMLFYKNDERIEYNFKQNQINLTNNTDITINKWNIDNIGLVFSGSRTMYNNYSNKLYTDAVNKVKEKREKNLLERNIEL